ncbi:NAD(P)H-hydrate dehydratase [Halomonas urumqiensis]|uniref:Bifunctional NAD(P)H-hydrate repair enzyme n=1 Tax=Halomonas urumqiensis TaxID=1684789 RepID=A0A2N7UCP4_9GAMM|nr:NAD(P)H-hydrate dehydratase [Halomonas urumqiensis]PMR78226.1 bifunctional ADP-dependent NAD(P)H-hydrate dehydratase/NAD(P)H-hydrate epimerase [Halomonas urumqiensis]PTB03374.1 NAD(P)H-hydrate dehydratase [Halomonas urumqiensis]GHE20458.1 bifunctional NAD(P)H-hydrate repair enzyme [Halomonas urumqiensis]
MANEAASPQCTALHPLYGADQVRELDRRTIAAGMAGFALMQRAASAAFRAVRDTWPDVHSLAVLCGGGNNGGDGHVLAALAAAEGLDVQWVVLKPVDELSGDARRAAEMASAAGVEAEPWRPGMALRGELLVDALLGTGLTGKVRGAFSEAIAEINASGKPVLGIDIPSGLHADSGAVLGEAVRATTTVTFIADKLGLHTGAATEHVGTLIFDPLGVDAGAHGDLPPLAWQLDARWLARHFPPRSRNTHKGDVGHAMILGGAPGFGGAALLAAEACARLGAGKISLATAPEHVTASLVRRPEVMAYGVRGASDLGELLGRAEVLVVGPGLGQGSWGQGVLQVALQAGRPLVVDADGLNLLASHYPALKRDDWILTPHPGEAARLLGISVAEVEADRPAAVQAVAKRRGGVVILKGAGSLVSGPSGVVVCPYGNPGMASGGMGDVLSGMLGALVAQRIPMELSAWLGVMVHAKAADMAAREAGERGLLAGDLASYARKLVNPTMGEKDAAATR